MKTLRLENGKIALVPIKEGAVIYKDNKKILELGLEESKSLMICFLDFAQIMMPPMPKPPKGFRQPKTGKHSGGKK